MNPQILFRMVLCNLIWSAHPLMSKILLSEMPPLSAGWARYTSALLAYLLIVPLLRRLFPKKVPAPFFYPKNRTELVLIFLTGFMVFCYSPILAFQGLHNSQAADGAIIVAMEPLMAVLLAWMFLKERISKLLFIAFAVAITGFLLLSGVAEIHSGEVSASRVAANALMVVALIGEASYSITARKLFDRGAGPLAVMGSSLWAGVISMTIWTAVTFPEGIGLAWNGLSWKGALALLWLGPMGTTAAYLVWMIALTEATVASLALTLFIQPVFGAIWGVVLLGDRFTFVQGLGAILILGAVSLQTFLTIRKN